MRLITAQISSIGRAAATGVKLLKKLGAERIAIDSFHDAEGTLLCCGSILRCSIASAEGAYLARYEYTDFKSEGAKLMSMEPIFDDHSRAWERGKVIATAQNMARSLYESLHIVCWLLMVGKQTKKKKSEKMLQQITSHPHALCKK